MYHSPLGTVGVKKKFRIPFRRTAVAQLINGEKTVRRLLKNGRSVRPLKIVYPIKRSDFLFTGSREAELFGLKKIEAVLFKVVSRRIVSSTTAQYRRFLDVRAFSGLDFLLLEVHQ